MKRLAGLQTERRTWQFRCLVAFVCFPFVTCSNPSAGPPFNETVTLTVGVPHPTPEDPLRGLQGAVRLVRFEGLSAISRDGRAKPRLALSWEEAPDGLSWKINLRPNAFFHDGSSVDAHAVKQSLTRSLAGIDRHLSPGLDDIASIETPSPHSLIIKLRERSTFVMDDLTVPITKRDESGESFGTGAYLIDSTSADEIVMRAFDRHYGGAPTIDRIRWKVYSTVRTAWAAMMRGEIDFLYEVGQDSNEFVQGEVSVAMFPFLRNYVYAIALNARRKPFDDGRVRLALNYAVNRSAIVTQGFKGQGRPESGSAWPQHWAYDAEVPTYVYEPQRGAALLDAAGVPPIAAERESGRPPSRFHFTCIFPEGFPLWEKIGLLAQRNFAAIGVDMKLQTVSVKEFNARISSADFDAVLSEFIVGNSPSRPFTFWYSKSLQNMWGYRNARVDAALLGIRRATSEIEYREAFREFQLRLLDDPPAVFLALGESSRAVSKRFRVIAPIGSDILPTIADWQLGDDPTRMTN